MQFKKISKKLRLSRFDIVKFQIITELLFIKKEPLIPSDIDVLTLLAIDGEQNLSAFCKKAANLFSTDTRPETLAIRSQNIRNRIVKLEKRGMIKKSTTGRKLISINPEFGIYNARENTFLDYNFISLETN